MLLREQRQSFGEYTDFLIDSAVAHVVMDVEMPVDLITALLGQGVDVEQLVASTVREMYSGAEIENEDEDGDELADEFIYTLH